MPSRPVFDALKRKLGELGWVEGRQIVFESRWADNVPERLPTLAAEFARAKVDIVELTDRQCGGRVCLAGATPLSVF